MSAAKQGIRTALSRGPGADFPELSARYLEEYAEKIASSLRRLDRRQIWSRPNEASNSAGNLVLHLAGNLTQWILSGIGGLPDERRRSEEFSARDGEGAEELIALLSGVVERCRAVLETLSDDDLRRVHSVQTYSIDGLGIVYHAVEHMSYHTGQIVWIAKSFAPRAVDFYPQHANE